MKAYLIIIIVFLKDKIVDFSSENVNTLSVSKYNPNPNNQPPITPTVHHVQSLKEVYSKALLLTSLKNPRAGSENGRIGLRNGYKSAALGTLLRKLLVDWTVLIHQGDALTLMQLVLLASFTACNHCMISLLLEAKCMKICSRLPASAAEVSA